MFCGGYCKLNKRLKADLHCHSYFSDGILSPEELIEKALQAEVGLFALTDHDTMEGISLLRDAAIGRSIIVVSGIELSVRWKMHDIHVIGLNLDEHCPVLKGFLEKQNKSRIERGMKMAELLEGVGVERAFEKACKLAGHQRIGRPHLAQILINEGVVSDMTVAFKRYLGKGKLAYVPTSWLTIEEAVHAITYSGGQAAIAHPLKYKLTRTKLNALIKEFKMVGGVGIEVVSGEMTTSQIGEMYGLCERFGLLASTGSDYHNDRYSRIKLGQQLALPLNCKLIWEQWNLNRNSL